MRLEKMLIDLICRETGNVFWTIKTKRFESPKNGIFPKGLTHAIGQKMRIFSLLVFGQNKFGNKV